VAVDGQVTLREAIQSINAGRNINADVVAVGYGANDTIKFNIAGQPTITLSAALDTITKPVTIDGWSQGGGGPAPAVEINGNQVNGNGLTVTAGAYSFGGWRLTT
jgi:hypothetical protein